MENLQFDLYARKLFRKIKDIEEIGSICMSKFDGLESSMETVLKIIELLLSIHIRYFDLYGDEQNGKRWPPTKRTSSKGSKRGKSRRYQWSHGTPVCAKCGKLGHLKRDCSVQE